VNRSAQWPGSRVISAQKAGWEIPFSSSSAVEQRSADASG